MADLIRITGIKGFGYHGVFEAERANGQDFYVDVELEVDLTRASVSDDVKDTINYAEVTDLVV
jgi:dihydroneopterin aldolase